MGKIVFEKWQIKKLVIGFVLITLFCTGFLIYATGDLYYDKIGEEDAWNSHLEQTEFNDSEYIETASANATEVTVGSYISTLKEINIKGSSYRMVAKIWFTWDGNDELDMVNNFHIYNGTINKLELLENKTEGDHHYQLCRVDFTVFKNFWTKRFPLESHQLRYYIEPSVDITQVVFKADEEDSGVSSSLSFAGYELVRDANCVYTMEYDSEFGDADSTHQDVTSEYMQQIEINRDGIGLYVKCFIALLGTSIWIFITLFICTFHRVDPLGMIPAALFGTVSNIMIGANLLPDALDIGLLEYVNFWGILTILMGALIVININRIRTSRKDFVFATLYGRIMFFTMVFFVVTGHVLLPIAAYMF